MIQGNAAERGWVAAGFLPWRRPLLRFAALLLLLCLAPALEAKTLAAKKAAAGEQFDVAEDLRSALERKPERRRTRQDYERVVEAYRSVYRIAPTPPRADPSAFAVAELLAEVGRDFKDTQALQDAVEQYQFLRREYPGSPRRFEALLMIAPPLRA